jgi:hypothetical protein
MLTVERCAMNRSALFLRNIIRISSVLKVEKSVS